jgi:glycosyltransferase involved in cell wall biosynthesis
MPLRVCFLSRISPMKNLDYALRVLSEVRVPVQFSIYGPIEDPPYWAVCEKLRATLPPHIEAAYKGPVDHLEVVSTLARHDLFLFPTRGENFGHVIHEALRAGLPLLIGDQTPWRRLAEKGVGWDLPLDDQRAFARRIEEVAGWSQLECDRVSTTARALSQQIAGDAANLDANRRLFLDAIGSRGGAS